MPIVEYHPAYFRALCNFVTEVGINLGLSHRPFVDYYYASSDYCRLYLLVAGDGSVVATYGVERMPFEYGHRELTIGFGANFYSIRPGAGGLLFVHAHKVSPVGLVYGGSPDSQRLIRAKGWTYYSGVRVFTLNDEYALRNGEGVLRQLIKSAARYVTRASLASYESLIPLSVRKQISVLEEKDYTRDLLNPDSPFVFRFAPTLDYLAWRYNTSLTFVRYRLFRILHGGRTAGYAVINESPAKLIVAHCDGMDPEVLAYGVILSILKVGEQDRYPRCAVLSSCHPGMQNVYKRSGFAAQRAERSFFVGTLKGPAGIASDTSNWLINYDWGDNGLRPPFPDQMKDQVN